jgi:hypothetical protein
MTTDLTCPPSRWLVTTRLVPTFPLGPRLDRSLRGGRRFTATALDAANRYLLLGGLTPGGVDVHLDEIDELRKSVAASAGWSECDTEPKVGCVALTGDPACPLGLSARQGMKAGWHPNLAGSAIISLAAAAATPGTVVADLLGGPLAGSLSVEIPGGRQRRVSVERAGRVLTITYELSPVTALVEDITLPVRVAAPA